MNTVTAIIADSQYLIRVGLRHILDAMPSVEVVGEACHERQLVDLLKKYQPSIVVLDYDQEDKFSPETVEKIRKFSPCTNVLVISGDDDKKTIYQVLESGVSSYLSKQCDEKEIMDAVMATSKGEKFYCTNVLNYLLEKSFPKNLACSATPLSPREIEIVRLVASGLIAKEIAGKLNLSTHTIYTHRKNIMKKLQIGSTSELVLYAVNEGIV
ncbi:MAG: response regulator transcription factor [Lewinellaceae bacterium]|nr:response regulator transcription factor [Saprospiraceae bacterium]MCB9339242.1 response regulator transcription factor [Lewinellaceae bacterium]